MRPYDLTAYSKELVNTTEYYWIDTNNKSVANNSASDNNKTGNWVTVK